MAEIPVEKKSGGIPAWVWLLLAALLIALLAWLLLADDDDDAVVYDDVETAEIAEPVGMADAFVVGEAVTLEGATVTELTGDMSFMINSEGRDAFVVFDQERTPNEATEGEYDINVGQTVDIAGIVMAADTAMPEGVDATIPDGMTQYIYADNLGIETRPES